VSPTCAVSIFDDDVEAYDTPMTTPGSSPVKERPPVCFPSLQVAVPQLDGGRGSVDPSGHDADEDHAVATARTEVEDEIRSTLELLSQNDELLSDDSLSEEAGGPKSLTTSPYEDLDTTPLISPSPAKGVRAFPFPQSTPNRFFSTASAQRRPSLLLKHCERNATPRQRRLLMGGLRSPDRFIASRAGTPAKEALVLPKHSDHSLLPSKSHLRSTQPVDPFAPRARRSLRVAEQYATLRAPTPLPRPVGRASMLDTSPQRTISEGAIWSVGGISVTEGVASTTNGRGGRVTSGTTAPHYTADFLRKRSPNEDEIVHGQRLAMAMDINRSSRVLDHSAPSSPVSLVSRSPPSRVWRDGKWDHDGPWTPPKASPKKTRDVPIIPFRVLDAPALRDDYYCSLLAYSATVQCLAVGLGPHVYLWSESRGSVNNNLPDSLTAPYAGHVTSISFSSTEGANAILAIGRADGRITLWSPLDRDPRFDSEQPAPVSCVCWRPNTVRRPSVRDPSLMVATDELLVGDEVGNVYYYSVEWPSHDQRDLFGWHGSMTLLARISCHTQQVCGIAWSPDSAFFASGGNDNLLYLFEAKKILNPSPKTRHDTATVNVRNGTDGQGEVLNVTPGQQKHVFSLNAAVKAVAFAPWQPTLLAAGGGSNDRCIHFFHTLSGANLATIDCYAQVTSLVWSERRKEIAATFGFAQPEHPYRVAVFSWPSCRMVVGVPWWGEERALYSIPYPRGPCAGLDERSQGKGDAEGRP